MLFRNKGVLLTLIAAVASVWLWLTGQLNLYIHPRYIVFTLALAIIAIAMAIAGARYDEVDDVIIAEPQHRNKLYLLGAVLTAGVCAVGALTLLLVKPATLTSAAANQRGINSASITSDATLSQVASSPLFAGDNYSNLSIKDWAGLLAQTSDTTFFVGKRVNLTGFVVADQYDPKNIFYVSRFVVTCCVVDARPLGVAVYKPGWRSSYQADSWVEVTGKFVINPSAANLEPVAVEPSAIKNIKQPDSPYAY
jgi:putative membrane protein